jgi:hypothetical protein
MKVGNKILPSFRRVLQESVGVSIADRATIEARILAEDAIWDPVSNTVPNSHDMKASAKKLIVRKP